MVVLVSGFWLDRRLDVEKGVGLWILVQIVVFDLDSGFGLGFWILVLMASDLDSGSCQTDSEMVRTVSFYHNGNEFVCIFVHTFGVEVGSFS